MDNVDQTYYNSYRTLLTTMHKLCVDIHFGLKYRSVFSTHYP